MVKRDCSSTLQAESIRTSLQRLEIGILSVPAHEYSVCWEYVRAIDTTIKSKLISQSWTKCAPISHIHVKLFGKV